MDPANHRPGTVEHTVGWPLVCIRFSFHFVTCLGYGSIFSYHMLYVSILVLCRLTSNQGKQGSRKIGEFSKSFEKIRDFIIFALSKFELFFVALS